MIEFERLKQLERSRDFSRTVMWPFIYMPILWVGAIHFGTRIHWLIEKFGGG